MFDDINDLEEYRHDEWDRRLLQESFLLMSTLVIIHIKKRPKTMKKGKWMKCIRNFLKDDKTKHRLGI